MKLTQGQLKQIIREEAAKLMEMRGESPRIKTADEREAGMYAGDVESERTAAGRPGVFTEESADDREDKNIDHLWAEVRKMRAELDAMKKG